MGSNEQREDERGGTMATRRARDKRIPDRVIEVKGGGELESAGVAGKSRSRYLW